MSALLLLSLLCAAPGPAVTFSALEDPVRSLALHLGREATATGNDARTAAALLRLNALVDELDDLTLAAEPFATVAGRRNGPPELRALARLFLARVERARGRTVKAREALEPLGLLTEWMAVGSFDNEGKGGCAADFGPESGPGDFTALSSGKQGEVGWRRAVARPQDGYVDLSSPLEPDTDAVGYAVTYLKAEAETKVGLSFGASGALRAFVNGVKVAQRDAYNLPRLDQERVQVTLRKGMNRLLVKVCQQRGPYGFYARLERLPGGKPVAAVLPASAPPLEKGPGPAPARQVPLAEVLWLKAKETRDARLAAQVAVVLDGYRLHDESDHRPAQLVSRAATLAPADAEVRWAAAVLEDDANRRRVHWEALAEGEAPNPFAGLELAEQELERERPQAAWTRLAVLRQAYPRLARAWLLEARAREASGDLSGARALVEEAFTRFPHVPAVARTAAVSSRRQGRLAEAIERTRLVLGLRHDDLEARVSLARMLVDARDVPGAAEQWRAVLALDSTDVGARLNLAELLAANEEAPEAWRLFAEARALAPDDAEVPEREGRARLAQGDTPGAVEKLTAALRLRPQQPGLRELVRALRGRPSDEGAQSALPLAPLLALGDAEGDDAVVLADVTHVQVQASGLASRFVQLVVKVATPRGVESFRALPITYSPARQETRVLRARVTKPDGSVVEAFGDDEQHINEPWTGMYYDARARVLSFPALAPGDVLEVQYRLDDTSAENLLTDFWGDVDTVQGTHRKRRYRYSVDMPAGRTLYFNAATLPGWVKATTEKQAERTVYHFVADDVPKVVPEPNLPGPAEVATPLHLSTFRDWKDVGRYYWGLVRDQLVPTAELQATVDAVLKGVDRADTEKVVAALYGFVVTSTRYVALEFGIHGYQPYRVDRVLARRFGDCKDKASLLHALLKVAGVDSRLVLLRMRSLGKLPPEPASLAAFNHAILYVPALDRYLDGTAEFHGSKELPGPDRQANVLVVEPDGEARFLTTPEATPEDNVSEVSLDVKLRVDGSAVARVQVEARGQAAPEYRKTLQTEATRRRVVEEQWGRWYPGAQVAEVEAPDVTALEKPVRLRFFLEVPRFAEAAPTVLKVFPFGVGRSFTQALAPLSERKLDVQFPGVWVSRLSARYALPPGFLVKDVPAPVSLPSEFGDMSLSATVEDGVLVTKGEVKLAVTRVSPRAYPRLRAWLQQVDQAFSRKLVLQSQGPTTLLWPAASED